MRAANPTVNYDNAVFPLSITLLRIMAQQAAQPNQSHLREQVRSPNCPAVFQQIGERGGVVAVAQKGG